MKMLWCVALAVLSASCVVIPTPTTPVMGIPQAERQLLKAGETTRADILMRYGEPDLRFDGDRVLVYEWNRIRAVLAAMYVGGGHIMDVEALLIEFDKDGRLARTATATSWKYAEIARQADEWAAHGVGDQQ